MPYFDWYGGEGSSSHRRIIIKELNPRKNLDQVDSPQDSSLLGKGRFSRVIQCKIKEESRICQKASKELHNVITGSYGHSSNLADANEFSQEIAVKVEFQTILLSYSI